MTPGKWFLISVPSLLVLVQLLGPERTNPPFDPSRTISSRLEVPADVSGILRRACHSCHSHQTVWPWYSNLTPVSWYVVDHVDRGRSELNLSDWARYDRAQMISLLEEMCELVTKGEMPLEPYLWMHKEAHLTRGDVTTLCEWTEQQLRLLLPSPQQ